LPAACFASFASSMALIDGSALTVALPKLRAAAAGAVKFVQRAG
jgi:hypothetical protein